jgi:hypothetical protein
MRPRYSVAGGKSDGFDSFVLAEPARTDSHRFRLLVPVSDRTKALRAMTRARERLVRTRVGLANQLSDQLGCSWSGAAKVFCRVDTQIALALLRRYPAPADARGLGEQRLAAFLKRHGCTGRKPARELLAGLRAGAHGRADELELQARGQIVLALVASPGADRRPDQRADDPDQKDPRGPPGWSDVPLAVHRSGLVAVRRDAAV